MKKLLLVISILSILISCKSKNSDSIVEEDHHDDAPGSMVSLTDAQMKAAGIVLDTIEYKNLNTSIRANGMLKVPNQNKALVTSVNTGVIKSLLIQPGDFVRKGQTVATLVNPDVARLQQDLQTTNAQISLAEIELKRQGELVEGNAAPLKNVQRVQTELATLRAVRNSLQKQLSAMGISVASVNRGNIVTTISVSAPISGTVSNVSAQIGSNVDPSTPLAEIVNNSLLHLDLFVFEKDLTMLHEKQLIHFTLTNNPGKEYDAEIFSIGTAFANASKTIPVHAVVKGDKDGLIEGMNITAVISIGKAVVPAVPTEAIISLEGQDYIFILADKPVTESHAGEEKHEEGEEHAETEDHKDEPATYFERVQVIKGTTDVGYTEIKTINELPAGTRVVTKGAFFVSAKMSNTGGHDH